MKQRPSRIVAAYAAIEPRNVYTTWRGHLSDNDINDINDSQQDFAADGILLILLHKGEIG